MKKIIIAIDGSSSTGKSTLAKEIAKALGYLHIDTGAMYRAVTYFALKNKLISKQYLDKEKLVQLLDNIDISFKYDPDLGFSEVYLNGKNIEKKIREMHVSDFVSEISVIPEVRKKLVTEQRKIGKNKGIVMDGRDIGSVVFPNAELKIFMTAKPEIKAQRRYDELRQKNLNVSYEEVLKNVLKRDRIDSTRTVSPLKKTSDAIEIDNTHLSKEQQFNLLLDLARKKILS